MIDTLAWPTETSLSIFVIPEGIRAGFIRQTRFMSYQERLAWSSLKTFLGSCCHSWNHADLRELYGFTPILVTFCRYSQIKRELIRPFTFQIATRRSRRGKRASHVVRSPWHGICPVKTDDTGGRRSIRRWESCKLLDSFAGTDV